MKSLKNTCKTLATASITTFAIFTGICVCLFSTPSLASGTELPRDTSVAACIGHYLDEKGNSPRLYYPGSVKRFYSACNNTSNWAVGQANEKKTWEAMLVLDCVLQFGLNHADYHPAELNYEVWHAIFEHPETVANSTKARYDILLTDALITLMNHLHYGKLNPYYWDENIDAGFDLPFYADSALTNARQQNDFMSAVLAVQPHAMQYKNLQYHMHLLEGLYTGDCYDTPDSLVRKIAINMERLRWAEINTSTYVEVNIPACKLLFFQGDSIYKFKVIVGKVDAPTPTLNSDITYFTTNPDRVVPTAIFVNQMLLTGLNPSTFLSAGHYTISGSTGPVSPDSAELTDMKQHPENYTVQQDAGGNNAFGQLVFRFQNSYGITLSDTPDKQLFKKTDRLFSNRSVRIEQAGKFARCLLKAGGASDKAYQLNNAIKKGLTRNISLKQPIPLKIVYLTCIVVKGEVIKYNDVYDLDRHLEMAMYNISEEQLSVN